MEFDREYFDGYPTEIIYTITLKGKKVEKVYKFKKKDLEGGLLEKFFCIEKYKYEIRNEDIDFSKKVGPFLIQGQSSIVDVK